MPNRGAAALEDPSEADLARLARQWLVALDLVQRHCNGAHLDQSLADLDHLQELLDAKVLSPKDTHQLKCLGIAFGRVLVHNVAGLRWAIAGDEPGRHPTIHHASTGLRLDVLTLISAPFERSEPVYVRRLYQLTLESIAALAPPLDEAGV